MRPDTFYLFACPFFWTFVGRYVTHLNFQEIVVADALYFTRTGATFDVLCSQGLQTQSLFHAVRVPLVLPDGTNVRNGLLIPAQGPKFPWSAPTPWVQGGDA